jgi:hypothetical protein
VPHDVVSEDELTSWARTVMAQGSRVRSKFVVLHPNKCCFIKKSVDWRLLFAITK